MNTKEQIYTGVVIAMGVLLLMSAITLVTLIYPSTEDGDVFLMVVGLELLLAFVYFATAYWNVRNASLTTISTTVQIATLFLSGYGIPIAVWGIVLLRRRLGQQSAGRDGVIATQQP